MEPNLFTLQNLGTLEGKWAMKKSMDHGCLGYIRDEILPSYEGIARNHYKDPY